MALGSAALDGYDETFSQLTDVDMKFGVVVDDHGEENRSRKVPTARSW